MAYKSDIEIAQECTMAPITELRQKRGSTTATWNSTENIRRKSTTAS